VCTGCPMVSSETRGASARCAAGPGTSSDPPQAVNAKGSMRTQGKGDLRTRTGFFTSSVITL
jgi:hypothetical protein